MSKKDLIIYCDGGSRGNPGPAASAFVVIRRDQVIFKGSAYLGDKTNNYAEYLSVVMALKWLKEKADQITEDEIVINLDSQLVTKQLKGEYKVKSFSLIPLHKHVKEFEKKSGKKILYHWSPRDKNKIADSLVNQELDNNI